MTDNRRFYRGDTVYMAGTPSLFGTVLRVARDESWVDVRWNPEGQGWTKRQPRPEYVCLASLEDVLRRAADRRATRGRTE